jgi:hypothetical protein
MVETKICSVCHVEKDLSEFNWRNISKGTKQSWCKECHRKDNKERYHHGNRKAKNLERNKKHRKDITDYINGVKVSLGCSVCGYNKCAQALDFHHINDKEKDLTVSSSKSHIWALERVKKEIEKCIVLCCRCHRELHNIDMG